MPAFFWGSDMHHVGFKPLDLAVKPQRNRQPASVLTVFGMAFVVSLLVGISIGLVVFRNIGG